MIGTDRTNKLKKLFGEEMTNLYYEVYKGSDDLTRVRTYAKLNDGFNTMLKLEELGVFTEALENELNNSNYTKIDSPANKKILIK